MEMIMKLYDLDLSGNCYKVRLFAALTGIDLEFVPVDLAAGEHLRPWFTALNPYQEVPVLVDGKTVLRDSQAILVYLAGQRADRTWWPQDPAAQAEIVQWLSVTSSEVRDGPNAARLIRKFGYDLSVERALLVTQRLLQLLDQHLHARDWFALGHPTIADCALFPYLALAHEGGIDVAPFRALTRWIDRVRALPGFVPMPGIDR
jgi:glutathione S-transferase